MILVTGGTGFIGKALIRSLNDAGWPVRMLIRSSPKSPELPKGIPVEVAVSSLNDERGLRAARGGVDTVFHLAGVERRGAYADISEVDIQGTRAVVEAAVDAGVDRFLTVSHLGADRASAYPVLKAKAISEEHIRNSHLDYTILRSAVVFGPNDGFTTALAGILSALPFLFLIPGDGRTLLQPLWVEDLVTCLTWALDDDETRNQTYEIGGPEYISFMDVVTMVMSATGIQRRVLPTRPPYLRGITVLLESIFPGLPVSVYWLDYLATNRTCALDTVPRVFNLMPARLPQSMGYLENENWRSSLWQSLKRRRKDVH
jgi:NADH dehydrogenase